MLTYLLACSSLSLYEVQIGGSEESIVPATAVTMEFDGVELEGFIDPVAEAEMEAPEVEPGDIAFATVDSITISILQQTGDLSFLTAVELYAEAPGMEKVLVAQTSEPPGGRGPLALDLMDVDLADYFVAGDASFPAQAWGETPAQDMTLLVDWQLTLGVTAQGIANAADQQ